MAGSENEGENEDLNAEVGEAGQAAALLVKMKDKHKFLVSIKRTVIAYAAAPVGLTTRGGVPRSVYPKADTYKNMIKEYNELIRMHNV